MKWKKVNNNEDIKQLNELYDFFEDSVLVGMNYISGNNVDEELVGHLRNMNDLKVTFQRLDRKPFCIELWFTHTKRLSFRFINPADNLLSDIMFAKICKNDDSIFWTLWEDFNPNCKDHLSYTDLTIIEAEELKWRIVED